MTGHLAEELFVVAAFSPPDTGSGVKCVAVIAGILFLSVLQRDIAQDLQKAIQGQKIGGPAFTKSVAATLKADEIGSDFGAKQTLGDKRGLIVEARSVSADENKFPIIWRFFVWPEGNINRVDLLKKAVLYKEGGTFTSGEAYWRDDRLVIAGSEVYGGNAEPAALTSYRYLGGRWKTVQHLEDKREGFATFARNGKAVDPSRVRVITRDYPKHLDEPHVGPLLRYECAWTLKSGSYVKGPTRLIYTPLAEMETLAGYIIAGNHRAFDRRMRYKFRKPIWDGLKKDMTVSSVTSDVYDTTNKLQIGKWFNNGPVMTLELRKGRWTVVKLVPHN